MPATPDVHCPICDEPLDTYELREIADATGTDLLSVRADFKSRGCVVLEPFHGPQSHCKPPTPDPLLVELFNRPSRLEPNTSP